jgi:hypothetical protein
MIVDLRASSLAYRDSEKAVLRGGDKRLNPGPK